jgi:hypothetical protein
MRSVRGAGAVEASSVLLDEVPAAVRQRAAPSAETEPRVLVVSARMPDAQWPALVLLEVPASRTPVAAPARRCPAPDPAVAVDDLLVGGRLTGSGP